ncbi:hypothetical protein POM88_016010 [Heracleum sosnowskyi]|uniref:Uncharacterized protein n=1 Tax=Heracleum sosnowskyi TaxID=360622 RepID=A0AAD8IL78_9APIA|nr:hypothetical protein POM88_016010 [Heracleum sosnowskyi]
MEKVDKWKAALTEAANLSGYDLQNDVDGNESKLIKIIVEKVLLEIFAMCYTIPREKNASSASSHMGSYYLKQHFENIVGWSKEYETIEDPKYQWLYIFTDIEDLNLSELRACLVRFRELPTSIGKLKNLDILVLNFKGQWADMNSFPVLTSSVFLLRSLKNLNLSDCHLVNIPDYIDCLSSLRHLNLSGNHFSTLTSSLGRLTNLESLSLMECKSLLEIQELPPKLSDIYAEYCESIITLDVSKLKYLRCLYLSYCSSLVDITGLHRLESVIWIDLEGCENLSFTFEKSLVQIFGLPSTGSVHYRSPRAQLLSESKNPRKRPSFRKRMQGRVWRWEM